MFKKAAQSLKDKANEVLPETPVESPCSCTPFWKVGFFVLLLVVIGCATFGYFYYKEIFVAGGQQECDCSEECAENSTSPPTAQEEWTTVGIGGYSFSIPLGWQVADSFSYEHTDPYVIFADPNPISSAPRGGPISAVTMYVDYVMEGDPYQALEDKKAEITDNLEGETEETITAGARTIYKYSGIMNIYEQDEQVERYVFLMLDSEYEDAEAYVVWLEPNFYDLGEYSDTTQRIAESFVRE